MSTTPPTKRKKKRKPSWQVLDYWQTRKLWRKQYKGVKHGLSSANTPKTRETHDLAMVTWMQTKARIDAQENQRSPQDYFLGGPRDAEETLQQMLTMAVTFAEANGLEISLQEFMRPVLNSETVVDNDLPDPVELKKSKGVPLKDLVKDFNTFMEAMAANKQRSTYRAGAVGTHLRHFMRWAGETRATGDVDEALVKGYHHHVLINDGAPSTKRDRFAAFKQFVTWLAEHKYCAKPANLDAKAFNFRVPTSQPKPVPAKALKAVLTHKKLDERLKLYLLLMANTGMQQNDMANMTAGMFDATKKTITRVRGKLAHQPNAPTIAYKLWPETHQLLVKHMQAGARPHQPLLLTADGLPLVNPTKSGGRNDRVRRAWVQFTEALGVKAPTLKLKQIRKTGATLIAHQYNEVVANHYLGDAPSGILAKNYVPPNQAKFNKALAWLRTQVL